MTFAMTYIQCAQCAMFTCAAILAVCYPIVRWYDNRRKGIK